MKNEQILIESRAAREDIMKNSNEERINDVLNKVKALVLLPNNTHVTIEMVANYYEVDKELIKYHIKQNKDELESDGLKVLKGRELKEFKEFLRVGESNYLTPEIQTSPSLTIIPRRAILRLGMLIQKSDIAKKVRDYLLNIEENTDINIKLMSISQETNNIIKLLQDDINNLKHHNEIILSENEELKINTYNLINKVDELLNQPLFKLYENSSNSYERLIVEFTEIMNEKGYHSNYGKDYALFNKEFSNWTGINFGDKKLNKKDYWLHYYGLDIIKHFIYGIKQGVIVKSEKGYWVDLNGIYNNKVEWQKILREFNNCCAYCGSDNIIIAEHILPKTNNFSTNIIYNLIPACSRCNESKGIKHIKDWYKNQSFFDEERYNKIQEHWKKYYVNIK